MELQQETQTVRQEISEIIEKVPYDQESVSIWDDAVIKTTSGFDQVWIDENLGKWMHDYFGHDGVLVLDRADRVIYSHEDGTTQIPPQGAELRRAIEPLVRKVRKDLSAAGATASSVQADDIQIFAGRPAVVSVVPIVPSSDRITQQTGSETLHVSLRFLDSALPELSESHNLEGARFSLTKDDPDAAYYSILNRAGETIGYFAWKPLRPGAGLIKSSLPILILGMGVLGMIILAFGRHLARASKELQAREAQAQHVAFHDALTGLPNRACLSSRLDAVLHAPAEIGKQVSVLYLDLDRFKNVNDTLGYAAGDELICEVAKRLKKVVREGDVVARFGGDEFTILQTEVTSTDDVTSLCSRIIEAVRQPIVLGGSEAYVGVSIGAVLAHTATGSGGALLRKADIALYRAKSEGPNSFKVFSEDMDVSVQQKRVVETDLRAALAAGDQLRVVYQPLFGVDRAEIVGVEALVRWEHPRLGTLSPLLFIQSAEESGLILQLGEWVLREACRTVAGWPVRYLAVNVSPLQFRSEGFAALVEDILRDTAFPAHWLELEVTEGILLDRRGSMDTLKSLRAMGVRIALDDFGTGYSSLSYLRSLNVDKIKIDRSFVSQLSEGAGSQSVVVAMVDLAKALGVEVSAEGVETVEQRQFLSRAGCDQLQGYLISKPQSAAEVRQLLGEKSPDDRTRRANLSSKSGGTKEAEGRSAA